MRVAFAGTPEFALPALGALLTHHELVGVLTQPDRPRGRGRQLQPGPVKAAALAAGLPLAQPPTLRSAAARAPLLAWRADVLVVVAYGLLLPAEVLQLPPLGCLNIHASLLPRWRGAAPVQRAILSGDADSGVTIMQMDEGLDTGPVLLQRRCPIGPADTAGQLQDALAALGAEALLAALEGLAAGVLSAAPQPGTGITYAAKIEKAEARIDWRRGAPEIERQVRAFNPWPIAETLFEGEQLRIYAARAESTEIPVSSSKNPEPGTIVSITDGIMRVACGTGLLAVAQVQRPGRRAVPVRDFSHSVELAGRRLG